MWWLFLIVLVFAIPEILSTILESRIGRAIAAQIENRGADRSSEALQDRVRELEGEVDRLAQDIHRLTEENEFFQRFLIERSPRTDPGDPAGERAP